MVFPATFFVAAFFPIVALAANDWTQPCHTGGCEWDLPATQGSGTMRLSGSNTSISDLTSAGGWTILDCDSTTADQDIRVVCHDPSRCDHIFQNGAENTVVRLPNNCSSEPFAVVSRVWNHSNQTIPESQRSLLERRGGLQRLVQGVSLSTDFAGTNSSQHGNITVLVVGSSVPGLNNLTETVPGCDAQAFASASHGCNATSVALKLFNPFSKKTKSGSFNIPPKTFQKNLFNDSFACPQSDSVPAFNGDISADLTSTVGGDINYAVTFAGVLGAINPFDSTLSLVVGFDASVDGALSLTADLTGTFSTGDILLFTAGLPGLDFGKVLKVGPTFNVNVEADASIATNLELDVPLSFTLTGGKLVFPPSQGSSSAGSFGPGSPNVKLSAGQNVTAKAQLAAHVKPSFEFGVTLLKQTADIFLELDTFAELDLSLTAAADASVSTGGSANSTSTSAGAGAGGCVDVQAGLAVNAGANADLFKIIKVNDKVALFSKSFDLFKKCFGNAFQRRNDHGRRVPLGLSPVEQSKRRRLYAYGTSQGAVERRRIVRKSGKGFSCPTSSLGGLSSIV